MVFYTNKGSHDPVLIQIKQRKYVIINVSVGETPSSWSQAMLTMGDDRSCRTLPVVRPPDSPHHSLATGIARDKAMSTL